MNTRRLGSLLAFICKILCLIFITYSISVPVQAEYYLVTGSEPSVAHIKSHSKHKVKHKIKQICSYKKIHRHRKPSPQIKQYLVWQSLGCCGVETWLEVPLQTNSCCSNWASVDEGYNVYYGQSEINDYTPSWGSAELSYNPDVATADDYTWSEPNLQQNYSEESRFSY